MYVNCRDLDLHWCHPTVGRACFTLECRGHHSCQLLNWGKSYHVICLFLSLEIKFWMNPPALTVFLMLAFAWTENQLTDTFCISITVWLRYRSLIYFPGIYRDETDDTINCRWCCRSRMRAGNTYMPATRPCTKDEVLPQRPAVVKKGDLESLDRLGGSDDCWASSAADVDYSQRLVFSDEEDFTEKRLALFLQVSE